MDRVSWPHTPEQALVRHLHLVVAYLHLLAVAQVRGPVGALDALMATNHDVLARVLARALAADASDA